DRENERASDDGLELQALLEIAADEQAKAARQHIDAHEGAELPVATLVAAPVGDLARAGLVEDTEGHFDHVARQALAGDRGDEIEGGARRTRAPVDDVDEPADAADAVLLGEALQLGVDGALDLVVEHAPRIPGDIAEDEAG